jgi:hypothetical protein
MHFWQILGLPVVLAASTPVQRSLDNTADQQAVSHNDQAFHASKFDSELRFHF